MKKIFFALLCIFAFSGAKCQIRIKPEARGGFTSTIITDVNGSSRSSFYVGAGMNFRFAKWYALQPELNYSRQGMTHQYFGTSGSAFIVEEDWNLDYLGLTLTNKFYIYRGLNLQASPYLDFLVNSKGVNPTNDVDTGFNIGIGYDFKNGLGIEMRGKFGGVDVFEDYAEEADDDDYIHVNSAFQIGVTYTFDLKKK